MSHAVRPATPSDAEALAAIHAACFAKAWPAAALHIFVADSAGIGFVALDTESKPAGFVLGRVAADEAEILTLAVSPAHRRQGVASALCAHLLTALRARGAAALFLEVSNTQAPALALYAGLGFTRVGLRPRYYDDGSDALLMRLDPLPRTVDVN